MRLTPTQIDTIHSTAQAVLGEGAALKVAENQWALLQFLSRITLNETD